MGSKMLDARGSRLASEAGEVRLRVILPGFSRINTLAGVVLALAPSHGLLLPSVQWQLVGQQRPAIEGDLEPH